MKRYTVVWKPDAEARLAAMWAENVKIRQEITAAANEIENQLAVNPQGAGVAKSSRSREIIRPPLNVLFSVSDADRLVKVIYVKFWED